MPTIVANPVASDAIRENYANTPSVVNGAGKAQTRKRRFQEVFPTLRDQLVAYFEESKMPKEAIVWVREVCVSV